MSCIVENLGAGLEIVRDSFRRGRISERTLRVYEEQFEEVFADFHGGRQTLGRVSATKGGLTHAFMDYIDEWFRLNRDLLWEGRRFEDIVNPEQFCRSAAQAGGYIQAYREQGGKARGRVHPKP